MTLPVLQYISQGKTPKEHLENIQNACSAGAELVQLRLKNVDKTTFIKTAKAARELTAHYQTRLLLNGDYKLAKTIQADGVHLGPKDVCPEIVKAYLGKFYIVGRSANTIEECKTLIKKKVDYISVGPFAETTTKAKTPPTLGLSGIETIIKGITTEIPIIAVGGITTDDVVPLLKTGVYGVAVSKAITDDYHSVKTFNQLLKGPSAQEQMWKPDAPK